MSKKNVKKELGRMREMMTYGLSEGKKNTPFSDVEYSRVGADGKLYGIVREGTKYYIKSAPQNVKPIKENFDYIGGFVNRKNNEYTSYANALKQFDLKMASLKEANAAGKKIMVESWNPDKRQQLTVESTNQMKREIARERQIMYNVTRINENKKQECGCCGDPFCKDGEVCHCDDMDIEKTRDNISGGKEYKNGVRKGHGIKNDKAWKKASLPDDMFEGRSDSEVLGWNDDYDYIDDSHGTEIGDDDPFTEPRFTNRKRMRNGVVGEGKGKALHRQFWNQYEPTPGTNDRGDDDPFTQHVNEAITDMDANVDNGGPQGGGLINKINDMDETLKNIASVLGIEDGMGDMGGDMSQMGDDMSQMGGMPPMGGDMSQMGGDMPPMGGGMPPMGGGMPPMGNPDMMGNANGGDFNDSDLYNQQQPANEGRVYESRDFRRMLNEDRLDYFGKHPAYQKRVMSLPNTHHNEFPGYYDMNDESVYSEEPYGEQIGDGAPFLVDPDELENAIAESIIRNLKKK